MSPILEIVMSFLPQSYEVPQTSGYMKFQTGKNRFRVLGSAIVGNEFWRKDGESRKPVRRRMHETIAASELEWNERDNAPEKVKHFWAFPVWNYAAKMVQILELTQKGIMTSIQALVDEADWGDPINYDITVSKSGSGLDTEYAVQPNPAKPLDPAIASQPLPNLEALFDGGDPFASMQAPAAPQAPRQQAAPAPAAAAKPKSAGHIAAQKAFIAKYPGVEQTLIGKYWKEGFENYFPNRQVHLIGEQEWAAFVRDGFVKAVPENPISEEPIDSLSDLPF